MNVGRTAIERALEDLRRSIVDLERAFGSPSEPEAIERVGRSVATLILLGADAELAGMGVSYNASEIGMQAEERRSGLSARQRRFDTSGLQARLIASGFDPVLVEAVIESVGQRGLRASATRHGVSDAAPGSIPSLPLEFELEAVLERANELTRGRAPRSADILTVLFEPTLRSAALLTWLRVTPDILGECGPDPRHGADSGSLVGRVTSSGRHEALRLGDSVAGSAHVLLGLIAASETSAAQALSKRGVSLEGARSILRELRS